MAEEQVTCNYGTICELLKYIVSTGVGAIMAVWIISKTTKANRVSNIHSEMCSCLIETIFISKEILSLLEAITKGAFYRQKVPQGEFKDNAHSRYWKEIGNLSKEYRKIRAKQELIFPSSLLEKVKKVTKKLNEGNHLARYACPTDKIFPDTTKLQEVVDDAKKAYQDFKKDARAYLGTPKLKRITMEEGLSLESDEEKEGNGR